MSKFFKVKSEEGMVVVLGDFEIRMTWEEAMDLARELTDAASEVMDASSPRRGDA